MQYVEQLEQFSFAKKVTGDNKKEKKRATFVSVIGCDAYNILHYSSFNPTKPAKKSFEELVTL